MAKKSHKSRINVRDVSDSEGVAIGPKAWAIVIKGINAVFNFGPGCAIIGTVGLIIAGVLVASILNISGLNDLLGIFPTPMAFATAMPDQSLIIVADFDDRSRGDYQGVDPAQYIFEQIQNQKDRDGLQIEIKRLYEVLDDNTALTTGEIYQATLVIWGWYDNNSITPRLTRTSLFRQGYFSTEEGQRFNLEQRENIPLDIITDLSTQSAFITFLVLGLDAYSNKSYDDALKYANSALNSVLDCSICTTNPSEAYLLRGNIAFYQQSNYQTAITNFNEAITWRPDHIPSLINRGLAHMKLNDLAASLADFERVILIDPNNATAYNNRGSTFLLLREQEQAIADYTKALELNPEYLTALVNRGTTYRLMGDYTQAIADYDAAIANDPDNADYYANRATAYLLTKNHNAALTDANHALSLDDQQSEAHLVKGEVFFSRKQYEAALAEYDKAILIEPKAIYYANRANIHVELQAYDLAMADANMAILINPSYAQGYYTRGYIYAKQELYELGLPDIERALQLDPTHAHAYAARGETYRIKGQYEAALADYAQAIFYKPDLAQTYYSQGLAYKELGRYEEAIASFDTVERIGNEDDCDFCLYWQRGRVHDLAGNVELAIMDYTTAIAFSSDETAVYYYRGKLYRQTGQIEAAIADFEHYLSVSDDENAKATVTQWLDELMEE